MKLTRKQKSKLNKAAFRAARKASPAKRKKAPKRAVRKANRTKARTARRTRTGKTFGYGVSLRRGRPWVKKLAGFSFKATNPRRKSTKRRTSRRSTARRSTRGVKRSARTGRFVRR